jgi:hypothetical protein
LCQREDLYGLESIRCVEEVEAAALEHPARDDVNQRLVVYDEHERSGCLSAVHDSVFASDVSVD